MNIVKLVLLAIIVMFAYILFIEQLEDVLDSFVTLPGPLQTEKKKEEETSA